MKKTIKYLSLILAALFIIAGSTMIAAFADDPPVTPAPDPEPVVVEPDPNAGGGNDGGGDTGGDGGYSGGDSGEIGDDGGSGYTGGDGGSGYTGSDNYSSADDYYQNNDDPISYSFDENGNANRPADSNEAAGSVTSNTKLYESKGISDKDAKPNQWSEITLDEKTTADSSVADFSSIKNDTNKNANQFDWIVYVGYALIGLAVLGILYFIIATAAQRKADRRAEAYDDGYYESEPRPRTSRFADEDDYRPRKSSRADTGEVYTPRRAR